jgi:thiosulfate dehydrogenase (quinone) large subunit
MSRRRRLRPPKVPSTRDPRATPRQAPPTPRQHAESARRPSRRTAPPGPPPPLEGIVLALVLLRIFLGVTFVYAGLDKLIDPTFLRAVGPGSIGGQLEAFTRDSPISVLVQLLAQPFPILTGLVISVIEIAIGLGALTGLLFRLSAAGGAALSILFWLTASWATKPYYYGPDLPYAAGWVVLVLSGHGGRFVLDDWLIRQFELDPHDEPMSAERRRVLEGGILGLGALALATLGGTLGSAIFGLGSGGVALDGAASPATGSGQDSAAPTAAPNGTVVGTVAALASHGGSLAFQDPQSGDPGVIVKLASGKFVAFDAVCTHAGCTVEFDARSGFLFCPCHGATFDPAHKAAVVTGPTNVPLTELPIVVDARTGAISLSG